MAAQAKHTSAAPVNLPATATIENSTKNREIKNERPARKALDKIVNPANAQLTEEAAVKILKGKSQNTMHKKSEAQNASVNRDTWPPTDLTTKLKTALSWIPDKPEPPKFKFKMDLKTAEHNTKLLRKAKFDLHKCFRDEAKSQLAFGSEFRPAKVLKDIFEHHPH